MKALGLDVARCLPYVYLKKSITVITESRFEYQHLLRFAIKDYVLDVRLERKMRQRYHRTVLCNPAGTAGT